MEYPLISVLVPVYNTEQYLTRCVESVLAQTYSNWEMILVDDGSTDKSGEICDRYAKKDVRIRVMHQKNAGTATARNAAMQMAAGELITFLDSDDCLHTETLSRLYAVQRDSGADIVECECCRFSTVEELKYITSSIRTDCKPEFQTYTEAEFLRKLLTEDALHQIACAKLFTRIAYAISFLVDKHAEDEYWTYQIIAKANKIAYIQEPLYLYFCRPGSKMQSGYSAKRLDGYFAIRERYQTLAVSHPMLLPELAKSLFGACMYHYQMILVHNTVDTDGSIRKNIVKDARALPFQIWKKTLPFKQRIWQTLFRIFPRFTAWVRNLGKIGW